VVCDRLYRRILGAGYTHVRYPRPRPLGRTARDVTVFDDFGLLGDARLISGRIGLYCSTIPSYFAATLGELTLWKGALSFTAASRRVLAVVLFARSRETTDPVRLATSLRGRDDRDIPRPHRNLSPAELWGDRPT